MTGDAIVVYQLPDGRTIAAHVPEWSVDRAKENGRADNMPVIAVVRPKDNRTLLVVPT